jgi:transcription elongation factor GreA
MADRIPMTRTGYEKLKTDLDRMQHDELPVLQQRVANARAEGDLSENAEYHGARESLGMLEARINLLKDKLSRATLVDPAQMPRDEVAFGATVVVRDLDMDEQEEFTLVGAGEEDYDCGKINVSSPLAQGLVGKKVGQQVEIQVPRGVERFEVLAIRYDS